MDDCIEHRQSREYGAGKQTTLHREVYCRAHVCSLEDIKGLVVRHKCDNPRCVNPEHLELGTQGDNLMDRHRSGRVLLGSRHPNSKLTENDVKLIRELRAEGASQQRLANIFQVSRAAIRQVLEGRAWKYV
jgi:hypothetical protein